MAYKITEEEAKQLKIDRQLYQDWYDVMDSLWQACRKFYLETGKQYTISQKDNMIFIWHYFRIEAFMVNDTYVEVKLYDNKTELLSMRYQNNLNTIQICFIITIADCINNSDKISNFLKKRASKKN